MYQRRNENLPVNRIEGFRGVSKDFEMKDFTKIDRFDRLNFLFLKSYKEIYSKFCMLIY